MNQQQVNQSMKNLHEHSYVCPQGFEHQVWCNHEGSRCSCGNTLDGEGFCSCGWLPHNCDCRSEETRPISRLSREEKLIKKKSAPFIEISEIEGEPTFGDFSFINNKETVIRKINELIRVINYFIREG